MTNDLIRRYPSDLGLLRPHDLLREICVDVWVSELASEESEQDLDLLLAPVGQDGGGVLDHPFHVVFQRILDGFSELLGLLVSWPGADGHLLAGSNMH